MVGRKVCIVVGRDVSMMQWETFIYDAGIYKYESRKNVRIILGW